MNYEKIYTDYFEKFCKLFESKIKRCFIENKLNSRTFAYTQKLINDYSLKYINRLLNEHPYSSFYTIFMNKNNDYQENPIQNIFKNEIKAGFEISTLKTEKKFSWIIKKIAFQEAIRYTSNQLLENNKLLENVFETQNFENFEKILKNKIVEIDIEIDNFDLKNNDLKLPTSIAILHELGFFELEKLKTLSTNQISKIVSIIQQKDPNSESTIRAIAGNIRVLNPDYKEDGSKYTSHKHSQRVKEILKNIK